MVDVLRMELISVSSTRGDFSVIESVMMCLVCVCGGLIE